MMMNNCINYNKEIYNFLAVKYPKKIVFIKIFEQLNYTKIVIQKNKNEYCYFSVKEEINKIIMGYCFKDRSNSKIETLDDGYKDKIINYVIEKLKIYPGGQQLSFTM